MCQIDGAATSLTCDDAPKQAWRQQKPAIEFDRWKSESKNFEAG